MLRERLPRRIILLGLILLALQSALTGFLPTAAIADGGGVDPPQPDTTGILKSVIIDTTGSSGPAFITVDEFSLLDLVILVTQAMR